MEAQLTDTIPTCFFAQDPQGSRAHRHVVSKMSLSTTYTYIQCPCSDQSVFSPGGAHSDPEEDERTFDPQAPRSNYSLYPLEYLLYCEDCQQIRCPRCVTEESVTYYCPNCLFEVPSSNLRSEGNRYSQAPFRLEQPRLDQG